MEQFEFLVQLNKLERQGASNEEMVSFIRDQKQNHSIIAQNLIPILTKALKDKNWMVRCWAAEELGELGSAAKSVVPLLKKALKKEEYFVITQIKAAIIKITTSNS